MYFLPSLVSKDASTYFEAGSLVNVEVERQGKDAERSLVSLAFHCEELQYDGIYRIPAHSGCYRSFRLRSKFRLASLKQSNRQSSGANDTFHVNKSTKDTVAILY